jgi:hypothetical protein
MDIDKPEYRDGTIPMDIDDPVCLAHNSSDSDIHLNHSLVNTVEWELEQLLHRQRDGMRVMFHRRQEETGGTLHPKKFALTMSRKMSPGVSSDEPAGDDLHDLSNRMVLDDPAIDELIHLFSLQVTVRPGRKERARTGLALGSKRKMLEAMEGMVTGTQNARSMLRLRRETSFARGRTRRPRFCRDWHN